MTSSTPTASDYIQRISREYNLYVLDTRAIPAMTDGLKTGQRIVLWLLRNKSSKIKTIALAGEMIASELYLHGDTSASDTISMLAGPFCNNRPLVHGIGAFGTRAAPTSFAAPRYTSVKRSSFSMDCMYVDLDIVPMMDNHDGSNVMPSTFLPLIPTVLLNGIKGIAPGWATNILPRRFEDLVGAVQDVLEGIPVRELLPHYNNRHVSVIRDHVDRSKYIIRGQAEKKNTTTVLVTELPSELSLEQFRERLVSMEDDGVISSFIDRSTENINVEIKMPRATLAKLTDKGIIEFFKIRRIVTENIVIQSIGGTNIKQYASAESLVTDWVEWRLGLYLDRFEKLLSDEKQTNLYWQYILACFHANLPDVITGLSGRAELKETIARIGQEQAMTLPLATDDILDRISGLPSYKWTGEGLEEAKRFLDESGKRMDHYTEMVGSDRKRKNLFKKEVGALL
jgi:DNA gyrase/topoisomerase IV subunit A